MAEKRMFSKKIIDSDAFLDMPLSTQALYFHLSMRADDEGFINSPRKISRMVGAGEDDLKLLIAKKFILPFESGVVVIKHWLIHNTIRKDRMKETLYVHEKSKLNIKENGAYTTSPIGIEHDEIRCINSESYDEPESFYEEEKEEKPKKKTKKKTEKEVDPFIEYANGNEELLTALKEFETMRKGIKKPLVSSQAKKRLLNKLAKLSNDIGTQIEILNQSSFNCWQDVWELKEENKQFNKPKNSAYTLNNGVETNNPFIAMMDMNNEKLPF